MNLFLNTFWLYGMLFLSIVGKPSKLGSQCDQGHTILHLFSKLFGEKDKDIILWTTRLTAKLTRVITAYLRSVRQRTPAAFPVPA